MESKNDNEAKNLQYDKNQATTVTIKKTKGFEEILTNMSITAETSLDENKTKYKHQYCYKM